MYNTFHSGHRNFKTSDFLKTNRPGKLDVSTVKVHTVKKWWQFWITQ